MKPARPRTPKVAPPLRQVSLTVGPVAEEPAVALLERVTGEVPGVYADALTGAVTASVYAPLEDAAVAPLRGALRAALRAAATDTGIEFQPAVVRIRRVPDRDWAESWKRHFRPIDLAGRLLVKPTWSRRKPRAGQGVILLDPGLSFGTGQHATTHFCLDQLVRLRDGDRRQSFLDAGTGSGILALSAARLGYGPVEAFDFDPDCVRIAGENAALNGLSDQVRIRRADVTRLPMRAGRGFDVVAANLLADLLISERDRLLARVAPGGVILLAGILVRQFPAVAAAYKAAGLKPLKAVTQGEWRSGAFRRPLGS